LKVGHDGLTLLTVPKTWDYPLLRYNANMITDEEKINIYQNMSKIPLSANQQKVLHHLIDNNKKELTNSDFRNITGAKYAVTASRNLKEMEKMGIIKQVSGSTKASKYELNTGKELLKAKEIKKTKK
jgi:hypothetical protein